MTASESQITLIKEKDWTLEVFKARNGNTYTYILCPCSKQFAWASPAIDNESSNYWCHYWCPGFRHTKDQIPEKILKTFSLMRM